MVNLLTDASFERMPAPPIGERWLATDDWEFNPASGAAEMRVITDGDPVHGNRFVRMIGLTPGNPNFQSENQQYAAASPGEVFTASSYSRVSGPFISGQGARIDLQFYDNTDSPIAGAAVLSSYNRATAWTRQTVTGTAPANTVAVMCRLITVGIDAGRTADYDAAQIERGTVATAFAVNPNELVGATPVALDDLQREFFKKDFKIANGQAAADKADAGSLEFWYWANRSGLTPPMKWSLMDHKAAYLRSMTSGKGTVGDMEAVYLKARSGLTPADKYSVTDHEVAYYRQDLGV